MTQQFQQLYPGFAATTTAGVQSPRASVDTTLNTLNGALASAQAQANDFAAEQTSLQSLEFRNQTAIGNLQALQVSNEFALAEVQQIQMLRQLVMARFSKISEIGSARPETKPDAFNWVSAMDLGNRAQQISNLGPDQGRRVPAPTDVGPTAPLNGARKPGVITASIPTRKPTTKI